MSPEKAQALHDAFPTIFRGEGARFAVHPSCGDGWYNLLYYALDLVKSRCESAKISTPILTDIKEKYGTLNIYYMGGDDYIEGVFDLAQLLSAYTCELCGNKAVPTKAKHGWIVTRCGECK
jgi:hypothetical protein